MPGADRPRGPQRSGRPPLPVASVVGRAALGARVSGVDDGRAVAVLDGVHLLGTEDDPPAGGKKSSVGAGSAVETWAWPVGIVYMLSGVWVDGDSPAGYSVASG
jgi:hypothetical protein